MAKHQTKRLHVQRNKKIENKFIFTETISVMDFFISKLHRILMNWRKVNAMIHSIILLPKITK